VNPLIIGPILELGKTLLDRFGPADAGERQKAEADFLRMAAEGELKQVVAQLAINAQEAAHPSIWVAGWRPFFGWVGGAGFGYAVVLQPLLTWYASINGLPAAPDLNNELLMIVITGMLGIGGLRTFEKGKGVSK
jgi:hypothetical protein